MEQSENIKSKPVGELQSIKLIKAELRDSIKRGEGCIASHDPVSFCYDSIERDTSEHCKYCCTARKSRNLILY